MLSKCSTEYPLKFFNGGRALTSVLSRRPDILARIQEKYGDSIVRVREYYELKKHWAPPLGAVAGFLLGVMGKVAVGA